jgi:FkbM family methyltransferase
VDSDRRPARLRAAFENWLEIIVKGVLWKRLTLPRREIRIRSRGGTTITAPLVPNVGALYGAIEVFALDEYGRDWDLGPNPFVVDIGANVGAWILWLAERQPDVRGICFEPDPVARLFLERNLEHNGLGNAVAVRPEAVTDRTGTASLFQSEPGEGASSLHDTSAVVEFDKETTVPTLAFADAMAHADGNIALLKLDCEGAEYEILAGSAPEAWARIERVVLEYHPAPANAQTAMRQRLAGLGFSIVQERHRADDLGMLWLERRPL